MALQNIKKPRRIIRLYHGSYDINIEKFDLNRSRKSFLDFGIGIYFTTNPGQAKLWSIRKQDYGAVYEVELDTDFLDDKQYLTYSNEFIDTFCKCRAGIESEADDIKDCKSVYGYVIDNNGPKIVKATNDYITRKANTPEEKRARAAAVRNSISVFDNKDQLCIKTQELLDRLKITAIGYTKYNGKYPKNDERAVDIRWTKIKKTK